MAGLRSSFAASGGALDALADGADTPKIVTVILRGRDRVAGLRRSFAASGGALDALAPSDRKSLNPILWGRERVAGLRSSFAASGRALGALADGADRPQLLTP